jgi:hypothetical protein
MRKRLAMMVKIQEVARATSGLWVEGRSGAPLADDLGGALHLVLWTVLLGGKVAQQHLRVLQQHKGDQCGGL